MIDIRVWFYLAAALAVFAAGYGLRHLIASTQIATLEREHSEAMGNIRRQKEVETQKVRDTEKRLNTAADQTREFHEKQLAQRDMLIDGLRTAESHQRATNNELRRVINTYTARQPATDPGCASDPRPATIGALLVEALGVAEANDSTARENTEAAERHADEVRTLKKYTLTVCR
jgi:hypothetical protein